MALGGATVQEPPRVGDLRGRSGHARCGGRHAQPQPARCRVATQRRHHQATMDGGWGRLPGGASLRMPAAAGRRALDVGRDAAAAKGAR